MKDSESTCYSQRALCCVLLLSLAQSTSGVCTGLDNYALGFRQISISNFNWNLTWNKPACSERFPTSYKIIVIVSKWFPEYGNSLTGHDCHQIVIYQEILPT